MGAILPDWGAALSAALAASRKYPGSTGSGGSGGVFARKTLVFCENSATDPAGFHRVPMVPLGGRPAYGAREGTGGTRRNPQAGTATVPVKMAESCGFRSSGTDGTAGTTETDEGVAERRVHRTINASSSPWSDAEDERAAIAEHEGGAPRAWAEALARLDPEQPSAGTTVGRWAGFVDDCGRFIDQGWPAAAESFGWGPMELFGCDRERPVEKIERAGLVWQIAGGILVELTAARAAVRTANGGKHEFRRSRTGDAGTVLAWQPVEVPRAHRF